MPTMTALLRGLRESDLPAPQRHVAMTITSLADTKTGVLPEPYQPTIDDLARMTGMSRRTIWRHVEDLATAGLITIDRGQGRPSKVTGIDPRCADLAHPDETRVCQSDTPPVPNLHTTCAKSAHHTSIYGSYGPTGLSTLVDADVPDVIDAEIDDDQALFSVAQPSTVIATVPNAGLILKAWIDFTGRNGIQMTKRIIGQYAKAIKAALDQGFDEKLIRHALADMLAEGVTGRPSYLDNHLVQAQQSLAQRPRRLTPGEQSAADIAAASGGVVVDIAAYYRERDAS